jgi:chromosomal replication initiator protein
MKENVEKIWSNCLEIIKNNVSKSVFETWFLPIKPVSLKDEVLTIQVPSQFFYEWLEENYVGILKKSIQREIGAKAKLEYSIIVENNPNNPSTINYPNFKSHNVDATESFMPQTIGGPIKNPFVIPGIKKVSIDSQLNPIYTFDSFVEGDCNRLARAAGYAIAQKPGGTAFNPLVLYGRTGMGKTHLIHAIGNFIKQVNPNKTVLYVSADKFLNQYVESIRNNSTNEFIHFYQLIDVLLVDDIYWLGGKEQTQNVFFHIFNHLHTNGKQIIITSDRAPKDLDGIEERLLSRLKWGLITELTLPDFDTRYAILEKKMYADGVILPKEVVEYVAYNINTNLRDLEGAMIALLAQEALVKREIDIDLAKKIVKNYIKSVSREVSVDFIQQMVSEFYNVEITSLCDNNRKRDVVEARQVSMYLARKFTKNSLKEIGKHFGGKDHSTVLHSLKQVEDQLQVNKAYNDKIEELKKRINLSYL